ncbi:MAG: PP2C family protein-serine/threonine phosphatase [Terriglobia bacterium]|jgi:sigma-B regulation protein RsbU (phosphoserine phosphatase)
MRDRIYLFVFLVGAGLLLYVGRGLIAMSAYATFGLTFAGTTAAAVLGMVLYRVQLELRASRHELARKEAELNFALEVQQALFPTQFPVDQGLEFSAVCVPARGIGGDYYDVLQRRDGCLAFAIADISGKGIPAAILMSNVHAVLRTLYDAGHPAGDLCTQLNRHLYRVTEGTKFATAFYAEWNERDRSLTYVNAGHPAPLLLGSCSSQLLQTGGPPLGIFPDTEFQVGRLVMQPGDMMVLFSDGITDAGESSEREFGQARLEATVKEHCEEPLDEIRQHILTAVRDWSGEEVEDDMTLLLIRARSQKEAL